MDNLGAQRRPRNPIPHCPGALEVVLRFHPQLLIRAKGPRMETQRNTPQPLQLSKQECEALQPYLEKYKSYVRSELFRVDEDRRAHFGIKSEFAFDGCQAADE
jgi:hypothetical protein